MPALTDADYERLAEFRFILRHFLIFSEDAAKKSGLAAQQHQALLAIRGSVAQGPVTAGILAGRLGIRHHSAVEMLDRLARKGLVKRERDPEDRRRVRISLTAKAERLLAKLSAAHRDELERLAPVLRGLLAHFERKPG